MNHRYFRKPAAILACLIAGTAIAAGQGGIYQRETEDGSVELTNLPESKGFEQVVAPSAQPAALTRQSAEEAGVAPGAGAVAVAAGAQVARDESSPVDPDSDLGLRLQQVRDLRLKESVPGGGQVQNPAVSRRYMMTDRAGYLSATGVVLPPPPAANP